MGATIQSSPVTMLCKAVLALALLHVATSQVIYSSANLCAQYGWPVGNYPHPTDCRKYLNCNGGVTYEMTCPAGLAFNGNTRGCDAYSNTPFCNYNGVNGYYPYNIGNLCGGYGWTNGNWYHPYDCTKYVQCSNGVTTIMSCPAGLTYSSALKTCSAGGVSPCRQYVFQPPVVPPAPYSCFHYVECTFGVTNHMPCPSGLAFNPA